MQNIGLIKTQEDAIKLLNIALEHEWAVSFEYTIHAYSMPKAEFFYEDPIMKVRKDARAQTIQIGIDEMYHALQLGIVIKQMGGTPSFKTDEVFRYPRIIDNLKRDKKTEDLVTELYRTAEILEGAFPKIQNMILNIAYDEVRHAAQFQTMIDTMEAEGRQDALCYQSDPENQHKEEVQLLHEIMRLENELMHRYLYFTLLFSEHQDLSQRLFKNSIDHMRHWDKNSGTLIKLGDVIRIENAVKDQDGVETSTSPMPDVYPGEDRLSALESLIPSEEELIRLYEKLLPLVPEGEVKDRITPNLALDREHLFTQTHLLENARDIPGLK
jgi:bacterioferritin (cytochrome b1)